VSRFLKEGSEFELRRERSRWREPNRIASDLSGFMVKPLKQSHANFSVYQADRCVTEQDGAKYHPVTVVIGLQSD